MCVCVCVCAHVTLALVNCTIGPSSDTTWFPTWTKGTLPGDTHDQLSVYTHTNTNKYKHSSHRRLTGGGHILCVGSADHLDRKATHPQVGLGHTVTTLHHLPSHVIHEPYSTVTSYLSLFTRIGFSTPGTRVRTMSAQQGCMSNTSPAHTVLGSWKGRGILAQVTLSHVAS